MFFIGEMNYDDGCPQNDSCDCIDTEDDVCANSDGKAVDPEVIKKRNVNDETDGNAEYRDEFECISDYVADDSIKIGFFSSCHVFILLTCLYRLS